MEILKYTTTSREGYREYKSNTIDCSKCPLIANRTESKEKRKLIQQLFGTAKEFHGLLYINLIGKEKLHIKIGLAFTCINIRKLAKMLKLRDLEGFIFISIFNFLTKLMIINKK